MEPYITIVTGLPRSGTSMMMRMLKAGGMDTVTDNIRQEDYDNPHGYYELEKVKSLPDNATWVREMQGRVLKMVSMLLFHLPADLDYRLIFMKRSLREVIQSQLTMLERSGTDTATMSVEEMETLYGKHLIEITGWIEAQPNIRALYLDYRSVIEKPLENAHLINEFIGRQLSVNEMCSTVDRNLYRNRAEDNVRPGCDSCCRTSGEEKEQIIKNLTLLGYM